MALIAVNHKILPPMLFEDEKQAIEMKKILDAKKVMDEIKQKNEEIGK